MTVWVTADCCCLAVSIHVPSGCDSNALTKSPPGIEQRMCVTFPCATVLVITQQSSDALSASQMYRKKLLKLWIRTKTVLFQQSTPYLEVFKIRFDDWFLYMADDGFEPTPHGAKILPSYDADRGPWTARLTSHAMCFDVIAIWLDAGRRVDIHSFTVLPSHSICCDHMVYGVNSIVGWFVNNPQSPSSKNIWKYWRHL